MSVEVVKLTQNREITIPESMLKSISLKAGDELMAYQSEDYILLKPIRIPKEEPINRFEKRTWTESDDWTEDERMAYVTKVVKAVRRVSKKR